MQIEYTTEQKWSQMLNINKGKITTIYVICNIYANTSVI